ncbi:hypothetical protein sr10314 [Sporisorium reilianum SRZ2]|uniref:Uncharacterized protein n=1 Tax=Sporisorium reilianum (strain SRZ2) TaxID=999809 RepID=E6ZTT9_SPORE|nr:hypothetical protein sr10314 [Sporisorium reilianum SRZ2]
MALRRNLVKMYFILILCCLGVALSSPLPAPMWPFKFGSQSARSTIQNAAEASEHLAAPHTQDYELPPLPESLPQPLHQDPSALHHPYSQPSGWVAPPYYPKPMHRGANMYSSSIVDSNGFRPSSSAAANYHVDQPYLLRGYAQPSSASGLTSGILSSQTDINPNLLPDRPLNLNFDTSLIKSQFEASGGIPLKPAKGLLGDGYRHHSGALPDVSQAYPSKFGHAPSNV